MSIWLSVDPLASKYPSISPYVYCAGNPVMFIDSDGRAIEPPKWWTSLVKKWNVLNDKEKQVVKMKLGYIGIKAIEKNATKATTMTISIFKRNGKGDKSDAFRHAYLQALNTLDIGEEKTESWSTAHEYSTPKSEVSTDLYMDIHNNAIGIEVAKNNPSATPDEIKQIILDKIANGEMLVINSNGKLTWSDGSLIKDTSKIRGYDKSKKIAIEILNSTSSQKTPDYE
jgi:hypothetical protein